MYEESDTESGAVLIEKLHIQGFRALRNVVLSFEPLTALVGPNSSGKSTVLQLLSPGLSVGPQQRWRKEPGDVSLEGVSNGQTLHLKMSVGSGRPTLRIDPSVYGLRVIQPLRLDLDALRRPNKLVKADFLSVTGDNLANVIGSLPRGQQALLAEQLCDLVPTFKDVDLVPTSEVGTHTLRFHDRWMPEVTYVPDEVSDGTILLLAFLVLQFQSRPPDLITIDEAERGFHPYLLGQYVDFLRKLSRGELGQKPIQVVLATHSAELLDHLEPEEVRFLSRSDDDGSIRVSEAPTASKDWEAVRAEYENSLGGIWLSGGLGGVPG